MCPSSTYHGPLVLCPSPALFLTINVPERLSARGLFGAVLTPLAAWQKSSSVSLDMGTLFWFLTLQLLARIGPRAHHPTRRDPTPLPRSARNANASLKSIPFCTRPRKLSAPFSFSCAPVVSIPQRIPASSTASIRPTMRCATPPPNCRDLKSASNAAVSLFPSWLR